MVTSDSRLRLEALASSLTTITSAKPDRDMTDVLPIIDVIFNEAHADRHGATKANELLSIVEQLLDNVIIKVMDDAKVIAEYTLPNDMTEPGQTVLLNLNGYLNR